MSKSIHELRSIAQGMNIPFAFSDDVTMLKQKIEQKTTAMIPKADNIPARPHYDARLMNKPPSKISTEADILQLLEEHIQRGLYVAFPEPEQWHMRCGVKEDTGTMRMPLRTVLDAAEKVMR